MRARSNTLTVVLIFAALTLLAVFLALRPPSTPTNHGSPETPAEAPAPAPSAGAAAEPRTPAPDSPNAESRASTSGPTLQLISAAVERDRRAHAGALEGRVVSWSTGAGVEEAELTIAHGPRVTSIRSGADGAFRFAPDEPGAYELAVVTADGFLPFAPEWGHSPIRFQTQPGLVVSDVVITLRPAIEYQGQVVDPEQVPVAGAQVTIVSTPNGQTDLVPIDDELETDEEGRFAFVAPDDALLEARHPRFSPGRARLDHAAQVSHRLTIELGPPDVEPPDGQIAGQVVRPEGEAIAGALITARRADELPAARDETERRAAQTVSDQQGRFRLTGLEQGRWDLVAAADGLAPARAADVDTGSEELRLELSAGGRLTGAVTDAATGEPVAGFSVLVMLELSPLEREPLHQLALFDPEGRYVIEGLAPGDYAVMATAQGHAPAEPQRLTMPDPPPQEPLTADFTLTRGGRLHGRVIDSDDHQPLQHARISTEAQAAVGSAVPLVASTTTDAEGRFELAGLSSGLRSVFVAAADHHSRLLSGLAFDDDGDIGPITIDLRPVAEGETPRLELTGIGAVLSARDDALVIGRAVEGGGAAEVGLGPGDAIVEIEGVSVTELGFQGSIERIRGPEGTTVRLTIRRSGTEQLEPIDVPRRRLST